MTASAAATPDLVPTRPAAPPTGLFTALLDDAAIFPPGNAPLPEAVRAHAASLRSADAACIGSFLCSGPRVGELRTVLPEELSRLALALVVPGGADALEPALAAVARDPRLALRAVELPAAGVGVRRTADALDALLPEGVLGYVELALDSSLPDATRTVAERGYRAKLRTGGTVASAFPSEKALAAGLVACLDAGAPFKLTAGLHHAVRHRDPETGFEHHGFLNVLAAVATGAAGGRVPELAGVLAERDGAVLASRAASLSPEQVRDVRARFVAFGTCSTAEPLADLRAAGLLPDGAR